MKKVQQSEQVSSHSKCSKCGDTGAVQVSNENGYEVFRKCECRLLQEIKQRKDNSGLISLLDTHTFENYNVEQEFQRVAKNLALEYVEEFKKGNKHSFAFLGQSGIGKTHLTVAISKELLEMGANVKYYMGLDVIRKLQSCKYDADNYELEFAKIANCGVLVIDDLFKGSITNYYNEERLVQDDLREIFSIISYRDSKNMPVIISSEVYYEQFEKLDQATIGRISKMCNHKYMISVQPDVNKNFRLNKRR